MAPRRVAVLISGRGSNLRALAAAAPAIGVEIALVAGDRAATGLDWAAAAGLRTLLVERHAYAGREPFEAALDAALRAAAVEIICLAGFMRVLGAGFVRRWGDRLLNVHPSLLPAFPGLDTHARALAAGVRVHGCSVHLVRPALDQGPILVQGLVPVLPEDNQEALAARVLEVEYRCYPQALALVAHGRVRVADEVAHLPEGAERLVLHPLLRTG